MLQCCCKGNNNLDYLIDKLNQSFNIKMLLLSGGLYCFSGRGAGVHGCNSERDRACRAKRAPCLLRQEPGFLQGETDFIFI